MRRSFRLLRWLGLLFLGLLALLLALAALAIFWLPDFTRGKAEILLGEALHRPVTIGAIELAPLELALTIRDVKVDQRLPELGVGPLVAFDEFHLDLSGDSFRQRAPIVSALRLRGPRVHLIREKDGRLNIADLEGEPDHKADEKPFALPDFSFANIEISDGHFVFEDRKNRSRQEISELVLGVPFAGTLPGQQESWVEPYFKARINGAPIEAKGKVKPFADRREATLELRLKDLDLTRLDEYAPLIPGLKLLSARFDLALDLSFVQAPKRPLSLRVGGEASLGKVALEHRGGAPYVVAAERVTLKLDEFDANLEKPIQAALAADALSLSAKGNAAPLLTLPRLRVSGASIDLKAKRIDLAALSLDGLRAATRREPDGQLDLLRLLQPPAAKGPATATAQAAAAAPGNEVAARPGKRNAVSPAWQARLARFSLDDAALHFQDQTLAHPQALVVEGIKLGIEELDLAGMTPAKLNFAATVNRRGRLGATGSVTLRPLAIDLTADVRELDLVPLQGWIAHRFNALLSRGAINLNGQLKLDGQPLVARFTGDGSIARLGLFDRRNNADIMSFNAVELAGVRLVSAPLAIDLKRVTLDEFFARVILEADGKLNLGQLVKAESSSAETPAAVAATETVRTAAPMPLRIEQVVVKKSSVAFSDRYIKPNYSASISGLEGRIAPVAQGERGRIDLRGLVDRSAPLTVAGEVDPFSKPLYLKLAANVKGIDMPSVSTYTERYLGYEIAKGKLSLDVDYHVENGRLTAHNRLFLDQLTLGQQVDNPDAISVPLGLAVSLLKNSDGEIDLKLPIEGSLDDPEFSVGRVFWKTLGNLLVKAASSPFAWIKSLFGEDHGEIWQVDFVPGRAVLQGDGETRLGALAKALKERPELRLDVTGYADPEADRAALAKVQLDRKLRAAKLAQTAQRGMDAGSLREITLTLEERALHLQALAREEKLALPPGAAPDAYESALLAKLPVTDGDLRQLAERRGRSVRNWLVDKGGIAVERVFVMVPRVDRADGSLTPGRAVFELR